MKIQVRTTLTALVVTTLWLTAAFGQTNNPPVKKSQQGICHAIGSRDYARTSHFEPYDSIEACLESGGRLSKAVGHQTGVQKEPAPSEIGSTRTLWALVVVILTLGAIGWIWFSGRTKRRDKFQDLEADARRKWEGHRRE